MAGSSSDPIGLRHDDEDDPSIALALALQAEEDERMAMELLQEEEAASRQQPPRTSSSSSTARGQQQQQQQYQQVASSTGRLPGERLAGAAHKTVQHLGRGTAKKIESHFLKGQAILTLAELLRIFRGDRREEMLMLIDAGQRSRVEAELVALTLDFPADS